MAVRDLGYKPYEGERLPASHNTMVLLRHGMRRAWASWLVKIAAFSAWIPLVVSLAIVGITYYIKQQMLAQGATADQVDTDELLAAADLLRELNNWQLWLFVTMVSLGAGAGAIAEDFQFKAFQFYFAKPVTPPQYLFGRTAAVALWVFILFFPPSLITILALVGTAPEELRLERAGLILPALFHAVIVSVVTAAGSVGVSSLSKSRALTMSAWITVLIVPHVVGMLVERIADWPWLMLASPVALMDVIGDTLYKIEPKVRFLCLGIDTQLEWWHAAPVLAAIVAGGLFVAYRRIQNAEVIT